MLFFLAWKTPIVLMATTAIGIGIVGEGVIVLSALLDICTNKAIVYTCVDMIAILSLLIACEYCWQSFTTAMFLYVWVSRWGWLLYPFSLSAMNCKGEGGLKQYLTKLLQTTVFYLFFVFLMFIKYMCWYLWFFFLLTRFEFCTFYTRVSWKIQSVYICFQHSRVWWEPFFISIIFQNTNLQKIQMSSIISRMKNMCSELDFTLNVLLVAYSLWRLYSAFWIRYMPNVCVMRLPYQSGQKLVVNIWVSRC